jgi:hypothetical protein
MSEKQATDSFKTAPQDYDLTEYDLHLPSKNDPHFYADYPQASKGSRRHNIATRIIAGGNFAERIEGILLDAGF